MTMPNPLVPEGSQLEQKSRARSRVKLAVFFVLSVHVVGLMALLVQGCRPEEQEVAEQPAPPLIPEFEPIPIPMADTNPVLQPPVTNLPPENAGQESVYVPPSIDSGMPAVAPAPTSPEPMAQTYAIQKGDTYYSIGKKFGVSMQAIKDANPGVEPTRLQLGQVINIPSPAPARVEAAPATPSGEQVYTVVSGDTLSKIAKQYGTTWQAIMELNNLPTTSIKVGDKLRIPATNPPPGGSSPVGY
jgi:LysM repeat protein